MGARLDKGLGTGGGGLLAAGSRHWIRAVWEAARPW